MSLSSHLLLVAAVAVTASSLARQLGIARDGGRLAPDTRRLVEVAALTGYEFGRRGYPEAPFTNWLHKAVESGRAR